jgi:hypothetical protein
LIALRDASSWRNPRSIPPFACNQTQAKLTLRWLLIITSATSITIARVTSWTLPYAASLTMRASLSGAVTSIAGKTGGTMQCATLTIALELDPQNKKLLIDNTKTYFLLRDYKQGREMRERLIALHPNEDRRWATAEFDVTLRADTRALHALLQKETEDDYDMSTERLRVALQERDTVAAERALERLRTLGEDAIDARDVGDAKFNQAYLEGLINRIKGDTASASSAFSKARLQQEKGVSPQPHNGSVLSVLGLIDAALGRKEDALREGRRALELTPPEKDSLDAADVLYYFAVICAWVGERDLAIEQLQASAKLPGGVSYAEICLDPHWDSLRNDPRFQKIVASLAPKEVSSK